MDGINRQVWMTQGRNTSVSTSRYAGQIHSNPLGLVDSNLPTSAQVGPSQADCFDIQAWSQNAELNPRRLQPTQLSWQQLQQLRIYQQRMQYAHQIQAEQVINRQLQRLTAHQILFQRAAAENLDVNAKFATDTESTAAKQLGRCVNQRNGEQNQGDYFTPRRALRNLAPCNIHHAQMTPLSRLIAPYVPKDPALRTQLVRGQTTAALSNTRMGGESHAPQMVNRQGYYKTKQQSREIHTNNLQHSADNLFPASASYTDSSNSMLATRTVLQNQDAFLLQAQLMPPPQRPQIHHPQPLRQNFTKVLLEDFEQARSSVDEAPLETTRSKIRGQHALPTYVDGHNSISVNDNFESRLLREGVKIHQPTTIQIYSYSSDSAFADNPQVAVPENGLSNPHAGSRPIDIIPGTSSKRKIEEIVVDKEDEQEEAKRKEMGYNSSLQKHTRHTRVSKRQRIDKVAEPSEQDEEGVEKRTTTIQAFPATASRGRKPFTLRLPQFPKQNSSWRGAHARGHNLGEKNGSVMAPADNDPCIVRGEAYEQPGEEDIPTEESAAECIDLINWCDSIVDGDWGMGADMYEPSG